MDTSGACPQCGSATVHGLCPTCGGVGAQPDAPAQTQTSKARLFARYALGFVIALLFRAILPIYIHHLIYQRRLAHMEGLRHQGPEARPDQLIGSGRIYLMQLGPGDGTYSLSDFAQWLHRKYALDVWVLPSVAVEKYGRSQPQQNAEHLFDLMQHAHPDLAADPSAYLIGFTDRSMYSVNNNWGSSFTQRYPRGAVISAAGMQENDPWARITGGAAIARQHLQARVLRILLKDVALLYWGLQQTNDPTSLLSQPLDPDIPAEAIYQSDLHPEQTQWGISLYEPCIFLRSSAEGLAPVAGPLIRECNDSGNLVDSESAEVFEIDLRLGLLIDKRMDFDLPGAVPIRLERATRDGWSGENAFGVSGTHNYDAFLGSRDNIFIDVIHEDGEREQLVRSPREVSDLDRVKYVDTDRGGNYYQMRWISAAQHYELRRYDGGMQVFLPCLGTPRPCFLNGYKDAQGRELLFQRDGDRRLLSLTSPNNWLHFSYGAAGHVSEITDSRGREVRYGYDARNRLTSVTFPAGEASYYDYDDAQHLLTYSAAQNGAGPQTLLRNEYQDGRLSSQTFANGQTFSYDYTVGNDGQIKTTSLRIACCKVFLIQINKSGATVWQRDPAQNSPHQ